MAGQHNPVLNGTTKKTILGVTIMVGLITMASLVSLVVIIMENLDFFKAWKSEGILGTITLAGLGILRYMIKAYMDTRTSQQKDEYKLKHYDIKMSYKMEKLMFKNKKKK